MPDDRQLHAEETDRLAERIESWVQAWLAQRVGGLAEGIDRDRPFAEYGLDSLTAVELSRELEDWLGVELTPVLAWNHPTLRTLARYLASRVADPSSEAWNTPDTSADEPDDTFEQLLSEIESIPESRP